MMVPGIEPEIPALGALLYIVQKVAVEWDAVATKAQSCYKRLRGGNR